MGIVSVEELPKGRGLSGKVQETDAYTRSFLVRVNDLETSLITISNAPGIALKDKHPENGTIVAMEYDVKCAHDSGLLWQVDFKYYVPPVDIPDDEGLPPPGSIEGFGKWPIWSGGSSVTTGPVTKDKDGLKITNSAGDPYEEVTKEYAEHRLSVTMYSWTASGWMTRARMFTNAVNSDTWNGGDPRTWKCQGCSAQLVTESLNGGSFKLWEITWDFAYRADTWDLELIDEGYNVLSDSNGVPSASGTKKIAAKGPKRKPVQGPVALDGMGGIADAGIVVWNNFRVYPEIPFGDVFGEVVP